MSDQYSVQIKVISQKGKCAAGHKAGDQFGVTMHTPDRLCIFAYSAIEAEIRTLMFGGRFPWSQDPDVYVGGCPDHNNPVLFELRRIPMQESGKK